MPLLFALGQRVIVSSVALLTSLILFNRQTLVQSRLLPATLSAVTLSMALVQVPSGGVAILRCPLAGLLALFPVLLPLLLSPLLLLRSLPADAKPGYNSVQARDDSIQQDIIHRVPTSPFSNTHARAST